MGSQTAAYARSRENMDGVTISAATGKYLLSGASGLVGSAICDALGAAGAEVLRLVRRAAAASSELHWNPAAESPIGSMNRLEGLDAAIHLSGTNVAAKRLDSRLSKRNVGQPRGFHRITRARAGNAPAAPAGFDGGVRHGDLRQPRRRRTG